MTSITIRNLDETVKRRLRVRAAHHGRSMEEEARDILASAVSQQSPAAGNLVQDIRARIEPLGGVDLPEIPREPMRDVPFADEPTTAS